MFRARFAPFASAYNHGIRVATMFRVVLVMLAGVAAGMALYRYRVVHHWPAGDWLVLYAPLVSAVVAQSAMLLITASGNPSMSRTLATAIGTAIAVLGWFVTL